MSRHRESSLVSAIAGVHLFGYYADAKRRGTKRYTGRPGPKPGRTAPSGALVDPVVSHALARLTDEELGREVARLTQAVQGPLLTALDARDRERHAARLVAVRREQATRGGFSDHYARTRAREEKETV